MEQINKMIDLGVLGGSGLYQISDIEDPQIIEVDTPFGRPSSPITVGTLEGCRVGFLARHGVGHTITPTEVNYRANLYALKSLGASKVLSVSACGSLREDYSPGEIVIPDQLFDLTKKRESSFFGDGLVAHIGVANPFCPSFSDQVFQAISSENDNIKMGGSAITIEGPRFSTKGESQMFRSWGIDLIGMTTAPEAFLALEAELCYTVLFHVTDYDVWHRLEEPVSVETVFRQLQANIEAAHQAVRLAARHYTHDRPCNCSHALKNAIATNPDLIPPELMDKLSLLIGKYFLGS